MLLFTFLPVLMYYFDHIKILTGSHIYMKISIIRNVFLVSFFTPFFVKGSGLPDNSAQQQMVQSRRTFFMSQAVALGSFLVSRCTNNSSLQKAALVVSGLSLMKSIADYRALSRWLPAECSVPSYLFTGMLPSLEKKKPSLSAQCTCSGNNVNITGNRTKGGLNINFKRSDGSNIVIENNSADRGMVITGLAARNPHCPVHGDSSLQTKQNSPIEERILQLTDSINALDLDTLATVTVKTGDDNRVVLQAPGNLMRYFVEQDSKGTLTLKTQGNFISQQSIRYQITLKSLEQLDKVTHKGSGSLTLPGFGPALLEKEVSIQKNGIGNLSVQGSVQGKNVSIHNSGSGSVDIGSVISAGDASINGNGIVKNKVNNIFCKQLMIKQSGISKTYCENINVDTVKIDASEVASVVLHGTCKNGGTVNKTGVGACDLSKLTVRGTPLKISSTGPGSIMT